jgi:hypothetical protein
MQEEKRKYSDYTSTHAFFCNATLLKSVRMLNQHHYVTFLYACMQHFPFLYPKILIQTGSNNKVERWTHFEKKKKRKRRERSEREKSVGGTMWGRCKII